MIEVRISPQSVAVATAAICTEGAAVHILFGMTVVARNWRRVILGVGCVAVTTGRGLVTAAQRKIRERVIENASVELDDVSVAAFVIGMTGYALTRTCRLEEPVKPRPRFPVSADIFVTRDAKRSASGVRISVVAGAAIGLGFRVAFDDAPRHYEFLQDLGAGGARHCDQAKRNQEQGCGRAPVHIEYTCTAMTCTIAVKMSR